MPRGKWEIFNKEVESLWASGQYVQALAVATQALEMAEKEFGANHTNVAVILNSLALVYFDQGQFATTEPLLKRALTIRQYAFSPDHPEVAMSLNNLALLYHKQGKYVQAMSMFLRALETYERASDVAGGEDYAGKLRSTQQDIVGSFLDTLMHNSTSSGTASVERAFWAMELVRSRAFLAMVLRSAAARQCGLSTNDALRDSEINAGMRICEAQRGKLSANDTETVSAVEERLSDLRVRRYPLDQAFATNYPRYMAMRKLTRMDVPEAQRILASNEVMIAYWDVPCHVFACAIGKTNFVFSAVSKGSNTFGEALQAVRSTLSCGVIGKDCSSYKTAALQLYKLLLARPIS